MRYFLLTCALLLLTALPAVADDWDEDRVVRARPPAEHEADAEQSDQADADDTADDDAGSAADDAADSDDADSVRVEAGQGEAPLGTYFGNGDEFQDSGVGSLRDRHRPSTPHSGVRQPSAILGPRRTDDAEQDAAEPAAPADAEPADAPEPERAAEPEPDVAVEDEPVIDEPAEDDPAEDPEPVADEPAEDEPAKDSEAAAAPLALLPGDSAPAEDQAATLEPDLYPGIFLPEDTDLSLVGTRYHFVLPEEEIYVPTEPLSLVPADTEFLPDESVEETAPLAPEPARSGIVAPPAPESGLERMSSYPAMQDLRIGRSRRIADVRVDDAPQRNRAEGEADAEAKAPAARPARDRAEDADSDAADSDSADPADDDPRINDDDPNEW